MATSKSKIIHAAMSQNLNCKLQACGMFSQEKLQEYGQKTEKLTSSPPKSCTLSTAIDTTHQSMFGTVCKQKIKLTDLLGNVMPRMRMETTEIVAFRIVIRHLIFCTPRIFKIAWGCNETLTLL